MSWSFSKNSNRLFLFLAQEKKQKNMHLKRIAKSSLHSGKKNNSFPDIENKIFDIGFVKQIFFLFLHSVQILYAFLLMCKMLLKRLGRLDTLISISGKNSYFKTSKCPKL